MRRLLAALLVPALLSTCALPSDLATSAKFDAASDKAIVVLGTKLNWFEGHRRHAHTLTTYWREYDPKTMRLVPEGKTFWTAANNAMRDSSDYNRTAIKVMEVEPGNYALIGAGLPESKSIFVQMKGGERHIVVRSDYLDPLKYIDPEAPVSARRNFLFSVSPGQLVYIGHFEFVRPHPYTNSIVDIGYALDLGEARETLRNYSGISTEITTLNLSLPTVQAAR